MSLCRKPEIQNDLPKITKTSLITQILISIAEQAQPIQLTSVEKFYGMLYVQPYTLN